MMKKTPLFKILASSLLVSLTTLSCVSAKTNFNEVGKQMVIMLRNSHYERYDFDEELGKRFFNAYIDSLDPNKQYFIKSDIDGFIAKYGNDLHKRLIEGSAIEAANEIYKLYRERAESRVAYVGELLKKEEGFTFDSDRKLVLDREEADWFETEKKVNAYWRDQIEQTMLSAVLRRETIADLADKQGKENPLEGKDAPEVVILNRFQRVLHSITSATDEDVADRFLSAVAGSYDPHTDYFSKSEMDRFLSSMQNSFVGIGATLVAEDDGATKIAGIVKGGPAYKGGALQLNDRIIAIDINNQGDEESMVDIMFEKLDKVVDMIRGQQGTSVRFKIEPAEGAPGEIKYIVIKRGTVELKESLASAEVIKMKKDVDAKERKLGYIKLPSFYADFQNWETRCSEDIKRLIVRLKLENVDGIIMDLRGNGGGSLEEVRRMTGFFTGPGPVVQVKDSRNKLDVKSFTFRDAVDKAPLYDGPLVVLIDKTSASASEILAGALQDYNRAVIVGDSSSFGKGTVQQPMEISRMMPFMSDARRAGVLKPTIQKFYRVSGHTTQLEGVKSDIVLPSLLDAYEVGEEHLDHALAHDVIKRAPGYNELNRANLFLPMLKENSLARIQKNQDFSYIIEDAERILDRREENTMSLNMGERKAEIAESELRKNTRNKERLERFAKLSVMDDELLSFYRLKLEDIELDKLVEIDHELDDDAYIETAKDGVADLDETPEWPSKLDPVKRESIYIISDLVDLIEQARVTGSLQKEDR